MLDTALCSKKRNLEDMECLCRLCGKRKKPKPDDAIVQNGTKPSQPAEEEPADLWDRAYKALQNDKDSAKLIKSYEKILQAYLEGPAAVDLATLGSSERQKQMSLLVTKKLEAMDEAQWKFHVGDKEIVVREQLDHIVKGVLFAKDFVAQAVKLSSDPHAAVAWAGVCLLLPVSHPTGFSISRRATLLFRTCFCFKYIYMCVCVCVCVCVFSF